MLKWASSHWTLWSNLLAFVSLKKKSFLGFMDCVAEGSLSKEFTHVVNSEHELLSDGLQIQTKLSVQSAI